MELILFSLLSTCAEGYEMAVLCLEGKDTRGNRNFIW